MRVTFIGSGNAFGSGGRFNTCFLLAGRECRLLIDCGASSLVALRHHFVDPNDIDGVVVSHLHGDHFGGLPFLLLDAKHMSKRKRPLFIWGPPGLPDRLAAAQEVLFPNSSRAPHAFPYEFSELAAEQRRDGSGFAVTAFPAEHSAGAPCFSLRVEMDGKIVTYSGDTAWTDALLAASADADLFICECSSFEQPLPGHLDYARLKPRLAGVTAKRVILTHLNPDMLERRDTLAHKTASDGLTIDL